MKQVSFLLYALFLVLPALFADPLDYPFEAGTIKIDFKITKNLVSIPVKTDITPQYNTAFRNRGNTYEIRYIFLGISKRVRIFDDLEILYPLFVRTIVVDIAGEEKNIISTRDLIDADIKKLHNADKGQVNLISGAGSLFGRGYRYIIVNFYFNKTAGIVCQALLYNESAVPDDPQVLKDLATFRFPE